MTSKRIPAPERRSLILEAARKVFAESGYEGAKTQRIAAQAKVSEALVYRHFPSKLALYRAVLRQLVRDQDANFQAMFLPEPSTAGLVLSISNYIAICVREQDSRVHEGLRMLVASLAGEGGYASLAYRRSQRKIEERLVAAIAAARAAGDIAGRPIAPKNFAMFQEHLGTMLNMVGALPNHSEIYDKGDDRLLRDAVWFCCRGIGLTDEAIRHHYDE